MRSVEIWGWGIRMKWEFRRFWGLKVTLLDDILYRKCSILFWLHRSYTCKLIVSLTGTDTYQYYRNALELSVPADAQAVSYLVSLPVNNYATKTAWGRTLICISSYKPGHLICIHERYWIVMLANSTLQPEDFPDNRCTGQVVLVTPIDHRTCTANSLDTAATDWQFRRSATFKRLLGQLSSHACKQWPSLVTNYWILLSVSLARTDGTWQPVVHLPIQVEQL